MRTVGEVAPFTAGDRRNFELTSRTGRLDFYGEVLASATSQRDHHGAHPDEYAAKGVKCSACRWFEVTLFRRECPGERPDYVVYTTGRSVVPGEYDMHRAATTDSAYEVVELLTIRRPGKEPFIVTQSAIALARASEKDEAIREAYVNRAVV